MGPIACIGGDNPFPRTGGAPTGAGQESNTNQRTLRDGRTHIPTLGLTNLQRYREQLTELPTIVASLEARVAEARAEMEVVAAMAPSGSVDADVPAARKKRERRRRFAVMTPGQARCSLSSR